MRIQRVALSVDVACFALDEDVLKLLLVQRTSKPYAGYWALPGGIVGGRETLDAAAERTLMARAGLSVSYLEQLYTFGDPDRDPRGRTVSVAYYALLPQKENDPQAGADVDALAWHRADALPPLAFDHMAIATYARRRLAQKISYTPLAFRLLPDYFTMADLRRVHEATEGRQYPHLSNFQTLMRSRWDLIRAPGQLDRRTKRPAQLYRYAGPREIVGPPSNRPSLPEQGREEEEAR